MKALGMIEVYGYLTAVEALDSALKAANVNLLEITLVQGGLVTVLVTGDVGATKAAMDASKSAAERVGKVISVHVIPRPSEEIEKMIPPHTPNQSDAIDKESIAPFIECEPQTEIKSDYDISNENIPNENISDENISDENISDENISDENASDENISDMPLISDNTNINGDAFEIDKESEQNQIDLTQFTSEVLQSMTVENLRKLARELKITNMTNKEIRFGTKNKLIRSISEFIEQER